MYFMILFYFISLCKHVRLSYVFLINLLTYFVTYFQSGFTERASPANLLSLRAGFNRLFGTENLFLGNVYKPDIFRQRRAASEPRIAGWNVINFVRNVVFHAT